LEGVSEVAGGCWGVLGLVRLDWIGILFFGA
jgi:hypothetical protein